MYDRYEGLIFDMDGTILDTELAHHQAWQQTLTSYGMYFDKPAIVALNGSSTWRTAKAIIDSQQVDVDPYQLAKKKTDLADTLLLDTVKPLPLIDNVVKPYHGRRPMAVGTGSEHSMAEKLLRHLGVCDYFEVIVGADDVEKHKPEPDTFLRCAKLLGVPPQKCVVFEDADFGVEAAKRANMAVVDVRLL